MTQNSLLNVNNNELEIIEFLIDERLPDGGTYSGHYGINVAKVLEIIRLPSVTSVPSKHDASVLGTFNLRGKVLPVGGIKEKILAAKRAGITDIVMCKDNRKDIEEIPEMYLKGVSFHYVEDVQDVWQFALTDEKVDDAMIFEVEENENKKSEA